MDPSLAAAVAASVGQVQQGFAEKMMAMTIDSGRSAVKLIDSAQQSFDRLANVSAGIGANVDVTA